MVKKHSTTALTKEQHQAQDKLYAQGHEYDYVIIGTGSSALTVGALLAHAGHKICMLEAHDIPGGYLQSFKAGDFHFCAQVHYIWGCRPGGKIYEFLKRVGLEKDITFELMDPNGYDHMVMPDGKRVPIPYGFDKLAENIEKAYPGQKKPVKGFLSVLSKLREEMRHLPTGKIVWWKLLPIAFKILNVIKYRNSTVQDLFDEFKLSKEAQAILMANAGDFMAPPEKLSLFMYIGLFGGYNTGSYYPTKHFRYYVDRLAKFITDHEGCHIYYETEINKINTANKQVTSIESKNGKVFKGKNYICNMDPQSASYMIGREHFPKDYLKKLDYEYSPSGVVIYLGLKDIDLKDYNFGSYNIWHLEQWDMNQAWKEMAVGDFSKPWVFMSTPTLHTNVSGTAPEGMQILEIASYIEYKPFKEQSDQSYLKYVDFKMKIANRMLDIVEEKYVPNIREHIVKKVIGTPSTNQDFVLAKHGNAYGSDMTPQQVSSKRLKADTPFSNLHWCNASSGWAGVYGTVTTGMELYMDLTGDKFYDRKTAPTDAEFIDDLPID